MFKDFFLFLFFGRNKKKRDYHGFKQHTGNMSYLTFSNSLTILKNKIQAHKRADTSGSSSPCVAQDRLGDCAGDFILPPLL